MRVRVVIEQTLFKDYYLSDKGLGARSHEKNLPKMYALFSEQLKQGDWVICKATIENIIQS